MSYTHEIAPIANPAARRNELARIGELRRGVDGTQILLEALADPYPPVRFTAAEALAARLDDELANALASVVRGYDGSLPDSNATYSLPVATGIVRTAAALALRSRDAPPSVVGALMDACDGDDPSLRYHALLALHACATEDDLREAVRRAKDDDDPGVLVVVAQVVAEHGWSEEMATLLSILDRVQGTDRFSVAVAAAELAERGGVLNAEARARVVDIALRGLPDARTTAAACQTLASLGDPAAIDPLHRLLGRWLAHPLNKVEAAAALVRLGDETGSDYLRKVLAGRRRDARGYAMQVVANLRLDAFFDELVRVANSDDYHSDTAVLALDEWGSDASRAALAEIAVGHTSVGIRSLARSVLAEPAD